MLPEIMFWAAVNVYALLLDAMALASFGMAYVLFRSGLVFCSAVTATVGALLLYGALGIHGTYGEKCRIYSVLLRLNARSFRVESFKNFMSVPCHRVLVRMILSRLGRSSEYSRIKAAYYRYPWQVKTPDATILHVFKSKEEGNAWLLLQQNKST